MGVFLRGESFSWVSKQFKFNPAQVIKRWHRHEYQESSCHPLSFFWFSFKGVRYNS